MQRNEERYDRWVNSLAAVIHQRGGEPERWALNGELLERVRAAISILSSLPPSWAGEVCSSVLSEESK